MKLRLVAFVAVAVSTGALADTTFNLGNLVGPTPIGDMVSGLFTDSYDFSVAAASKGAVVAFNTWYDITPPGITLGKISSFSGMLDGTPLAFSSISTPISPGVNQEIQTLAASTVPLAAGMHTLTIAGAADFSSAYTGSIKVTPVPEPETWALMLAGLGALGTLAYRRRAR
nr:FxDxF family PEP-CTERM protein [uncultured Roseateles sp.]